MIRIASKENAAAPMIIVSLATRIFVEMSLNSADMSCAEWICPMIGLLMSLPLLLLLQSGASRLPRSVVGQPTDTVGFMLKAVACVFYAFLFLTDCALIVRLLANTANITALITASTPFLVLPVAVLVFAVCIFGADAAARSARVWLYIVPVLLLIILVVQFRRYEPAWLTPILGSGERAILGGGLDCAGLILLFSLIPTISFPDRHREPLILPVLIACVLSAILLALTQMLSPIQTGLPQTQATRLKLLLSNGRVALILQIVLVVLWYGSLLHIISAESIAVSSLLQTTMPKIHPRIICALTAILTGVLASVELTEHPYTKALARYRFPIIGGTVLMAVIILFLADRRKKPC